MILSFDAFIIKCRILDEACRQWCEGIDTAPERRDGLFFQEFFEETFSNQERCENKQKSTKPPVKDTGAR